LQGRNTDIHPRRAYLAHPLAGIHRWLIVILHWRRFFAAVWGERIAGTVKSLVSVVDFLAIADAVSIRVIDVGIGAVDLFLVVVVQTVPVPIGALLGTSESEATVGEQPPNEAPNEAQSGAASGEIGQRNGECVESGLVHRKLL
jgi:hypothetical protein